MRVIPLPFQRARKADLPWLAASRSLERAIEDAELGVPRARAFLEAQRQAHTAWLAMHQMAGDPVRIAVIYERLEAIERSLGTMP